MINDSELEKCEAELKKRTHILLETLEKYEDNNSQLVIKSKQKSLYL